MTFKQLYGGIRGLNVDLLLNLNDCETLATVLGERWLETILASFRRMDAVCFPR